MVDDHAVDVPPADHMLVVRNDDSPGVIGLVGTVLGEAEREHRRHGRRPVPGRARPP